MKGPLYRPQSSIGCCYRDTHKEDPEFIDTAISVIRNHTSHNSLGKESQGNPIRPICTIRGCWGFLAPIVWALMACMKIDAPAVPHSVLDYKKRVCLEACQRRLCQLRKESKRADQLGFIFILVVGPCIRMNKAFYVYIYKYICRFICTFMFLCMYT